MVQIHSQMHNQHSTLRFLPWHRIFLYLLENELASIHPDVTLPYWDWTQASEQTFPAWLAGFTPTITTPSGNIAVTRSPGTSADLASFASNVPATMALTDFGNFSLNGSGATWPLEGIHDVIHVWVGGTMGVIATAPADPIFWMHHAMSTVSGGSGRRARKGWEKTRLLQAVLERVPARLWIPGPIQKPIPAISLAWAIRTCDVYTGE